MKLSAAVLQKGERVQTLQSAAYILRKAGAGSSNKGDEEMREEDTQRVSVCVCLACPLLR